MGWRTKTLLGFAVALVGFVGLTSSASATPRMAAFLNAGPGGGCPTYPAEGGNLEICSGEVPSFDGTALDVDLTKPTGRARRHPLIVMLHGFANDKHEWESTTLAGDGGDKWRWNSLWFARHGYYVLTYTARGFRTDSADDPYEPSTPPGSSLHLPNGTIHLKSREFEIRDTQWLAALTAEAFPDIDPSRIAVTGNSYGGGESWLQATQPVWSFPNEITGGDLPVLDLQVAVPRYGWTDLGYSLSPNGHAGPAGGIYDSALQRPDKPDGAPCLAGLCSPIGTVKLSYVNAFYALGLSDGLFESGTTTTPSTEGPINIPCWKFRLDGPPAPPICPPAGDPYDLSGVEDAIVQQARRGLTEFRGSYYQDEAWAAQAGGRKVAIFSIQGWTDDLFPAVESFRQFRYLKALDPRWPVAVALADVGHPRARNVEAPWHVLNTRAFAFLQSQIRGSHEQRTTVFSEPTVCAGAGGPTREAATPEGLASGTLTIHYPSGGILTSVSGLGDPDGLAIDPVGGSLTSPSDCRVSEASSWPGRYTAVSDPLAASSTYVGLGTVSVPYSLLGGTTATLHARLWDVPPSGKTLFVDRGTYRLDTPAYDTTTATLELPLFGNHWLFEQGHRIRLDLTQVDAPFLRSSNVPSSISFGPPVLALPVG